MMDLQKQKENFKNHVAKFTDYGKGMMTVEHFMK